MVGYAAVQLSTLFEGIPVKVPIVRSETPIIIRLCPNWLTDKGYVENGWLYFSKEKVMKCNPGDSGASGGLE